MNIQTCFYKKINISYNEAKYDLLKYYSDKIYLMDKWVKNPTSDDYVEFIKYYPEYNKEYMSYIISLYSRRMRLVNKGFCKESVMRKYSKSDYYIKDKGHFKTIEFRNIFTINKFVPDILFSLKETLDFINDNKSNINYYMNKWETILQNFCSMYPDGMIDFN